MREKTKFSKVIIAAIVFSLIGGTMQSMVFAQGADTKLTLEPKLVGSTFEKSTHSISQNTFTIIHDTHFHGNFGDPKAPNNIANYFGIANKIKAEQPNSLFIGNGDDLGTSVISATFKGQPIVDAFNAGKLDVDTFGNHDFDMGPDQLTTLIKASQFSWVSANAVDKRTGDVFGKEAGANRFIIKEVNGVKIGITGLINEEAPQITSMGPNAIVLNPVEAMKTIIPQMKAAGAQFIILSSHLASPDARIVASKVDGIDLIIGDHAAFAYESPEKVNNTLLWFIGDEFTYLGEINFDFENGKVVDFNYHRYALKTDVAKEGLLPDLNVKAVMDKYIQQLSSELDVQIGTTTTAIDVMKASQRKMETSMGDLVTDAMKDYTHADAAIINGGGIRAERIFPVGPLTKKDLMDAMPFTNYVMKLEVSGKQIYQALENGISQVESSAGRYPQVSGIQYSYNPKLIPGARLLDVRLNGKTLNKDSKYTIAVVDFMANGGDGYGAFKRAKVLLDKNAGPLLSKVVSDYIEQKQTISPKTEGRIQISDKTSTSLYADMNGQNFEAVLSIMDLTNQGLMHAADKSNNFKPESIITRAEFIKILVSALKLPVEKAKYTDAAQKAGILGSISKTEEFLRRDEMAVLLSNALPLVGNKLNASNEVLKALDTFKDKEILNTAMKNEIAKSVFLGLIFGKTDNKNVVFAPNDLLTRVQASVVIERLINLK